MFLKKPKDSKHISISLPNKRQDIFVGEDSFEWTLQELPKRNYSGFIIFCDKDFVNLYSDLFLRFKNELKPANVILVEASEKSKSLEFLNLCLERCTEANLNRKGCFVAMGGGIVGDVAGFLASVYMRGVDMFFIPTTLMAQGDAIINKVGISYKLLKNIIGSFYSPTTTVCDTIFLRSLPDKEISLGFSEIIKHALISSKTFTEYLLKMFSATAFDWKACDWDHIIYESLQIKGKLVAKDPYDQRGAHKGLSYGHTFANVLEGLSEFDLRHGEAVALGMRISGEVSHAMGILKKEHLEIQERLLNVAKLPSKFPDVVNLDQIVDYLKRDKISTDGKINLVILERIGKHKIIKDVNESLVKQTLTKFLP